MSGAVPGEHDRAVLYARLPVVATDRWWLDLASASPDGRVLELGAGTGRLTSAFVASGAEVTAVERDPAMLQVLRDRLEARATVVAADVVQLPPLGRFGLVALPSSLLNELPDAHSRQAALAGAAACCHPEGRVAIHVLGPWWLTRMPVRADGQLEPADGGPSVEVTVTAEGFDPRRGRRRATLTYRFPDGALLSDRLDAAVVSGGELELATAAAGLVVEASFGGDPPDDVPGEGPAWHLLCRLRD